MNPEELIAIVFIAYLLLRIKSVSKVTTEYEYKSLKVIANDIDKLSIAIQTSRERDKRLVSFVESDRLMVEHKLKGATHEM